MKIGNNIANECIMYESLVVKVFMKINFFSLFKKKKLGVKVFMKLISFSLLKNLEKYVEIYLVCVKCL